MARTGLEALDDVPWERMESAVENHPPKEMRRALRRLALKGAAATEEDCYPLFDCFALGTGRVTSVATAVLPFIVGLAGDREMGARVTLVELLTGLAETAAKAEPGQVDAGWAEAWRRHRAEPRALLADPLPRLRRQALPLAEGVGDLMVWWHAETDPTVRLPVLLALGDAAAASADAGEVDRVRTVLAEVLRTDSPVMRVAAVRAWAAFEPQAAVRELDMLVEIFSGQAVRPQFEAVWYVPDIDDACTREDVVSWITHRFEGAPRDGAPLRQPTHRRGTPERAPCCAGPRWTRRGSCWWSGRPRPARCCRGRARCSPTRMTAYGRAAHLLAVLGVQAAPYADELAALLDDPGEAEFLEGTVGDHARWA